MYILLLLHSLCQYDAMMTSFVVYTCLDLL